MQETQHLFSQRRKSFQQNDPTIGAKRLHKMDFSSLEYKGNIQGSSIFSKIKQNGKLLTAWQLQL